MTRLSVNVNKIATLRNARGGSEPNVIVAAQRIQSFGADGITVHPRPDARHITYDDVRQLRDVVHTEFNIEGYPSDDFVSLVCEVRPEQVTLVPDPPDVLTSNAGWTVTAHRDMLKDVLARFTEAGIRTSLFKQTKCKLRPLPRLGQTALNSTPSRSPRNMPSSAPRLPRLSRRPPNGRTTRDWA